MIILPPPRISNAGGFLDSDAIDVEHMQQRRFVAIHIGAYLTKGFLVQMERYLERGVVTPEADAALRRIVISACVRKMEGHQCSHDTAQPAALFAAVSAEITGRFTGMLALAGPELLETPVRLELVRRDIALDPGIDEANVRRECFSRQCFRSRFMYRLIWSRQFFQQMVCIGGRSGDRRGGRSANLCDKGENTPR